MVKSTLSSANRLQRTLRHLYESRTADANIFRYGLLAFDVVTIAFIVATSFLPRNNLVEWLDVIFGLVILADFSARMAISRHRLRELLHPTTWADIAAIVSFLAPLIGEAFGFLRILRTVRLLRSYQLLARLRTDFDYFRVHEDVIIAATNLAVFVFVMTGVVYESQHGSNPLIANYADALYFTVTALTTTGFGDITLPGTRRAIDFGCNHDLRSNIVLGVSARRAAAEQGALRLSEMRPGATRARRGSLQGLRGDSQHSG